MVLSVEFRVLGPLEVQVGAQLVPVTSSRQQATLAALLLDPGQVVSTDRIAEAIWDDRLPSAPANQVAICVSALRRKLVAAGVDKDLIVTRPPGYLIDLDKAHLDTRTVDGYAAQVRVLLAGGYRTEAVDRLRQALGMWRGPVLSGLESRALAPEIVRWAERRLTLTEECVQLELELGRHHEVIAELAALVTGTPLRERARRLLMLALARAGRTAEALEQYQIARRLLADELGLEPGPELRATHEAILRSEAADPAPAEPVVPVVPRADAGPERPDAPGPRVPGMLPADIADLTGREAQVAELRHALTSAPDTVLPVALVVGRGGVGKTVLAVRAAHQLRDLLPDGQLYVNLNGAEARPTEPLEVLARFLRELGVDSAAIPEGVEQRAERYRSLLADRRILVVLDNAADEAQVQHLLPGSPNCAVLITSRARLTGLGGAHLIELDVLDRDAAVELLGRIIGKGRLVRESGVDALVEFCGGLPLAVRIVGARLAARPHWSVGQLVARLRDRRRRLDELSHGPLEVRASLTLSYQGLPVEARRLFRRLGLLDAPDFASWVGAPLLGVSPQVAADLFEILVDAYLLDVVRRDGTGQVRYRFHDLLRLYAREQAVQAEPAEERRAVLSRALGAWLNLAEQAHGRLVGGDYAVIHGDAPRWDLGHELTEALVADPRAWYEAERLGLMSAIRLAAGSGLDEVCWDLAVTSVSLFGTRSHYDEWRESHEVARSAVSRAGNRRGEAAVLTGMGDLYVTRHQYELAERYLEPALRLFEQLDEWHGYAIALRKAAYSDAMTGRYEQALRRFEHALTFLRDAGDRGAEGHVLRWIGQIYLELGRPEQAAPHLEEAMVLANEAGPRGYAQAVYRLGELALARGRVAAAEKQFSEVLTMVLDIGDRRGEGYALHGLGRALLRSGRNARAERLLTRGLTVARDIGDRLIEIPTMLALAELAETTGAPERSERLLREAVGICRDIGAPVWLARCLHGIARLAAGRGEMAAARDSLDEALGILTAVGSAEADGVAALLTEVTGREHGVHVPPLGYRTMLPVAAITPTHRLLA